MVHALTAAWAQAGITRGDVVLLHSSAKRTLLTHRLKRRELLDTFLEALGPEGTLLLPVFNFEFTRGMPFDIRKTPSHTGALSETGRQHERAVRTGHPIYSFVAIGARASEFAAINNRSGYGADSPFAMLRAMDGKIAVLDLEDQHSMTFYHHVEEMCDAPYRYFKAFSGPYINAAGAPSIETYRLFVRDLGDEVLTHVNPCGELMWQAGLYHGERPMTGAGLRTISARAMFDFVAAVIDTGRAEGLLYQSNRQSAVA
jgi:aminoglycoside 3-N-acetyltransferase